MYNPNEFHLFHNILYYLFEKKLKLKRWYYHFTVTLNHQIKTRTVLSHANSYGNYYEIFPHESCGSQVICHFWVSRVIDWIVTMFLRVTFTILHDLARALQDLNLDTFLARKRFTIWYLFLCILLLFIHD